MSPRKYFSYIRVSTQKQGQHGTSLTEQQAAIERFANSWKLPIVKRFEERETAAKQGRPVFLDMLKQLKSGRADGVIIHKIDRSARNLKDWADLGNLIDNGIEVHFASESLDLTSRGGRLSADIQAVVASDYVRNLSEEAKKGLYGRLKQGLYPFKAMIGYLDTGSGKPKEQDPLTAPLIRRAFELYATGRWALTALTNEMNRAGLRTKTGKKLSRTGLAVILHNSFYMGLIRLNVTAETYAGIHRPIVSKTLFDQVQETFAGKNTKKVEKHTFIFRRLVYCSQCRHVMTPEIQKGTTYYRCRTRECLKTCLKEDQLTTDLQALLRKLAFTDREMEYIEEFSRRESTNLENEAQKLAESIQVRQAQLRERSSRLADAYVDGVFDEATYIQKKNELTIEDLALNEKSKSAPSSVDFISRLDQLCELSNSAYTSYKSGSIEKKRDLVVSVTANISSDGKSVLIKLKDPFQIVVNRQRVEDGWGSWEAVRTITQLYDSLVKTLKEQKDSLDTELIDDLGLQP